VYSFGVMLLEIICCRKSVDVESGKEDKAILTYWTYDCFQEGALDFMVEYDMGALDDMEKLERFVKVAIWCIQEDTSLRPTMRRLCICLKELLMYLFHHVHLPLPLHEVATSFYHSTCKDLQLLLNKHLLCFVIFMHFICLVI
jgi:hypothetical protein